MNAEQITLNTLVNGGGSYCWNHTHATFDCVNAGLPYYILSLHPELERVISLDVFCIDDVARYIFDNHDTLMQGKHVLGTWVDDGNVYLDVSTIIHKDDTDEDQVKRLAHEHNQLSFYDNEHGIVIDTYAGYVS